MIGGDRLGDLSVLDGRTWDAVFDLATIAPLWVRRLGEALEGRVGRYLFVSTISVYADHAADPDGIDESGALLTFPSDADPFAPDAAGYGDLKGIAEEEAERWFPARTFVARPGAIVGPRDAIGAFSYWPYRILNGGEILVPGDPDAPVQFIDVRDLAEWMVRCAEAGTTGVYNAIGPAAPMKWGEMVHRIATAVDAACELTWVPGAWIAARGLPGWDNLHFWTREALAPGLMRSRNERAIAAGLTFRPVERTAVDVLEWMDNLPSMLDAALLPLRPGLSYAQSLAAESALLDSWKIEAPQE
jgi:2'-hydroxyisoflavone reductase